jgi:hypothetical protein
MTIILETERLFLRQFTETSAEVYPEFYKAATNFF